MRYILIFISITSLLGACGDSQGGEESALPRPGGRMGFVSVYLTKEDEALFSREELARLHIETIDDPAQLDLLPDLDILYIDPSMHALLPSSARYALAQKGVFVIGIGTNAHEFLAGTPLFHRAASSVPLRPLEDFNRFTFLYVISNGATIEDVYGNEYFKKIDMLEKFAFFTTTMTQCEDGRLSFELCAPYYEETGLPLERLHTQKP